MVSITTRGRFLSNIHKKLVVMMMMMMIVVTDMSVLQICFAQIRVLKTPGPPRHCVARLLSTSRGDSAVANRVIKDVRRKAEASDRVQE